jgi:hypothetical protein
VRDFTESASELRIRGGGLYSGIPAGIAKAVLGQYPSSPSLDKAVILKRVLTEGMMDRLKMAEDKAAGTVLSALPSEYGMYDAVARAEMFSKTVALYMGYTVIYWLGLISEQEAEEFCLNHGIG